MMGRDELSSSALGTRTLRGDADARGRCPLVQPSARIRRPCTCDTSRALRSPLSALRSGGRLGASIGSPTGAERSRAGALFPVAKLCVSLHDCMCRGPAMSDCVQIELACPLGSAFAASTRAALRPCESGQTPAICQSGSYCPPCLRRVTELRADADKASGDKFVDVIDRPFTLSARPTMARAS